MITKPDICKAFTDRFDRMVCLNLAERTDRRENVERQFRKLGIDGRVEFHTAVMHPHNDIIIDALRKAGKGNLSKPNEFSCAREHYTIIKKALLQGVRHLLIFEDDILFLNDFDYIVRTLNAIPEDFECVQFGGFTVNSGIFTKSRHTADGLWMQGVPVWNMSMVGLGREAMQMYVSWQDFYVNVADMAPFVWNNADTPKGITPNPLMPRCWLSAKPVVVQDLTVKSNIRNDELNKRNATINEYEAGIDIRKDYGLRD